ncbi:hypothetical protein F4553_005239 [Allocatelliglobosispora scoriae]|uniref:DUF11 domain-containing protein n=1 Tax=Allocatelliglobosispora scoriae TaxID=643052 RepID=A0A841BYR5_9ACTN|nr:hypothetical protein [Allocatelliglobosispora scoriae]MBB5871860.1 hypothetical protein [Allocatelliglobosispora scoriae]
MFQRVALVAVAIGAGVGLPAMAAAQPAAPLPQAAPSAAVTPAAAKAPVAVTVRIDNGVESVDAHSRSVYRITVRNDSDVDYPAALIAQMLPASLQAGDADPAPTRRNDSTIGDVHTNELQWVRHLPARGEVTIEVQGAVGAANDKRVLTTTACVLPDGKTRPMICDSDSDDMSVGGFPFGWTALGVALAGLAGGVVLMRRRRLWQRPATLA